MLRLVNQERTSRGLSALVPDPDLTELARKKSADMAANNYFAHVSPTYGSVISMVRDAKIPYRVVGENLAKARSVYEAHFGLMGSPSHRANLLYPAYTHLGLGIVPNGSSGILVTQIFVGR